ncbi:TonB-dependent receptor [Asticcacaulis solisilvae]|uniref:TonB-dependent receptor n=1 Tax=Asticcacaulis solisilvae TaxID=1217274 RepID=UPI003FD80DD5
MRRRTDRNWSWLGVCAPVFALAATPVAASEQAFRFNLPAAPLADSLNGFSVQSGTQVLFAPDLTAGRRSPAIAGMMPREAALEQLLAGTDLTFRLTQQNVFLVVRKPAAPVVTAPAAPPAVVTVFGLRQKLISSIARKRSADHVVDTIVADDVGKFPDANLAESLQRVPGVSISRSHGEGYQVTVRGFGPEFNTVLMDGDLMPSRNTGREFNFNDLSADFIGAVDVYKTTALDMPSGGIGATIDIRLPQPFDYPGNRAAFTLAATVDSGTSAHAEPVAGGLVSEKFLGGKLGILASFSRQSFTTHENSVAISAWKRDTVYAPGVVDDGLNTTGHIYTPQSWLMSMQDVRRTRTNGRLVVQYRPDDRLEIGGHIQYSDLFDAIDTASLGTWFTTNDPTTANVRTNANGTVVDYYQLNAMDVDAARDRTRTVNLSTGANLSWHAQPGLTLTVSANSASSVQNPHGEIEMNSADVGYANQSQFVLGQGHDALPYILRYNERLPGRVQNGGPPGNGNDYLDPSMMRPHILPRQADNIHDTINQLRLHVEWKRNGWRMRSGLDLTQRLKNVRQVNDVSVMCLYCGYPATPDLPDSLFTDQITRPSDFINGFANAALLPPRLIRYDVDAVARVYEQASGQSLQPVDALSSYRVREQTTAGFIEARNRAEVFGMPLTTTGGLRYEATHLASYGTEQSLVGLTYVDLTLENSVYGPEVAKQARNHFAYWLPAVDFRLDLSDAVTTRLGLSRTLTRPPVSSLNPTRSITFTRPGNFAAQEGNPYLRPYLSDNLDLTVEWYYSRSSYVSLNLFHKHVDDFIATNTYVAPINGVLDPSTGSDFTRPDAGDTSANFVISRPENGGSANVTGEELAFQHLLGGSGFGLAGNITLVGTDKPFDVRRVDQTMAVAGLSNSANLVLYYERGPWQARAALNWRDSYLSQIGQSQDAYEPTFVNAHTQLDATFSYQVTKSAELYGYATNLLGEPLSTHGRFKEQFLSATSSETRLAAGIRLHF